MFKPTEMLKNPINTPILIKESYAKMFDDFGYQRQLGKLGKIRGNTGKSMGSLGLLRENWGASMII